MSVPERSRGPSKRWTVDIRGCSFCSCIKSWGGREEPKPEKIFNFFHGNCDTCIQMSQAEERLLCPSCRHLRPRHILSACYVGFGLERRWLLDLGSLAEIQKRARCVICCIIVKSALSHLSTEEPLNQAELGVLHVEWLQKPSAVFLQLQHPGRGLVVSFPLVWEFNSTSDPFPPANNCVSLYGDSIKWEELLKWLAECRSGHGSCSRIMDMGPVSGVRLIDIHRRCLTSELNTIEDREFVALSYVWGRNPAHRGASLTTSTELEFERPGRLSRLPRAVEDAFAVCKRLNQRFLWVDRLCIVQDDRERKLQQINLMAQIFASAVVTIVAASSKDMDSPMAGVSSPRAVSQAHGRLPGVEFISSVPHFPRCIDRTAWSKRGWTYQEAVLCPRKLYFLDLEVWYECDDGFKRESRLDPTELQPTEDPQGWPRNTSLPKGGRLPDHAFPRFAHHLRGYTNRCLTYQSDIYNAFAGILDALYPGSAKSFGLPHRDFDRALLWRSSRCTSARDCSAEAFPVALPSWSWASVEGRVSVKTGRFAPLVQWSLAAGSGDVQALECNTPAQWEEERCRNGISPQFYLAFAWMHGCIDAPPPPELPSCDAEYFDRSLSESLLRRWPKTERFWEEVHARQQDLSASLLTRSHELDERVHLGVLLTRAQTAKFMLRPCKQRGLLAIVDDEGGLVGTVQSQELKVKADTFSDHDLGVKLFEFMAVSISGPTSNWDPAAQSDAGDAGGTRRRHRAAEFQFRRRNSPPVTGIPAVDVLLIEWREGGPLARRLSIGWIFLREWVRADRTWKTVALE